MRTWRLLVLSGWFLGISAGVFGQQLPPHPIDPDRPDLTNSAHLVDPGFVQFEVGGIYTRESDERRISGSPVGVRIGVRHWIEARVGFDGVLRSVEPEGNQ